MVMSQQKAKRLKPLLDEVPPGFVVDAAWLVAREIDRKSIHNYKKHGWLESVIRGVYRRPFIEQEAAPVKNGWEIPVLSMQKLMNYNIHVGGKTALDLNGFAHYLGLGQKEQVHLYGKAPPWLNRLPDGERYIVHSLALFGYEPTEIIGVKPITKNNIRNLHITQPGWSLIVSEPERAILELLNGLPKNESFHIADTYFEALASLRPALLQTLLKTCKSVKVKRLFFVLADRHNHAWRKHVNPEDFDLGAGPRMLVEGGQMHPDYHITVPKEFSQTMSEGAMDGP